VSWSKRFPEPIVLPDGRKLETLSNARAHILALPEDEQAATRWQTAAGELLKASDPIGKGPWIDFARIGMMQALYPKVE
jgi:hypothetical protein